MASRSLYFESIASPQISKDPKGSKKGSKKGVFLELSDGKCENLCLNQKMGALEEEE